jgi:hypothetical protein
MIRCLRQESNLHSVATINAAALILVQHHEEPNGECRQPLAMRQDRVLAPQWVSSSNSQGGRLPKALILSVNQEKRPEGPTVPSRHHAR